MLECGVFRTQSLIKDARYGQGGEFKDNSNIYVY